MPVLSISLNMQLNSRLTKKSIKQFLSYSRNKWHKLLTVDVVVLLQEKPLDLAWSSDCRLVTVNLFGCQLKDWWLSRIKEVGLYGFQGYLHLELAALFQSQFHCRLLVEGDPSTIKNVFRCCWAGTGVNIVHGCYCEKFLPKLQGANDVFSLILLTNTVP